VAMASAGPYANLLLTWTDNHASIPPHSFFTGWMPFLLPNQQRQSTEDIVHISITDFTALSSSTLLALVLMYKHLHLSSIHSTMPSQPVAPGHLSDTNFLLSNLHFI